MTILHQRPPLKLWGIHQLILVVGHGFPVGLQEFSIGMDETQRDCQLTCVTKSTNPRQWPITAWPTGVYVNESRYGGNEAGSLGLERGFSRRASFALLRLALNPFSLTECPIPIRGWHSIALDFRRGTNEFDGACGG
jgi:hypothetical protein